MNADPTATDARDVKPMRPRRVTGAQFRLAIQLALIAALGYAAGKSFTAMFVQESAHTGGLWCATTGIAVLSVTREATWREGIRQILGAFIGALTAAIALTFFSVTFLTGALSVGITVLLCQWIGFADTTKLAATAVVVILVVSNENAAINPFVNAALRFSEACIGVAVAMAVAVISPKAESATHTVTEGVKRMTQ